MGGACPTLRKDHLMRIPCPLCGTRDRREFTYFGSEDYANRPAADAPAQAWDDHLHNRDNPCGDTRDLWYHDPCGAWVRVHRNTASHAVHGADLVAERGRA